MDMKNTDTATALLLLPKKDNRAVRSALMAMKVMPLDLIVDKSGMLQLLENLHAMPHSIALIDLDAMRPAMPTVLALAQFLDKPALRQRVVLTRHSFGPMWASDRAWVKRLGFCDLFAELDSASLLAESHDFLDHVAQITDVASINPSVLSKYFSAMQVIQDKHSPRGLIRKITGVDAQSLCALMASNVKSLDRTYRLKSYPSCFLGSDAVTWLSTHFRMPREMALEVGQALQKLDFVNHVVHEQPFADAPNFYRTAVSSSADRLDLGAVLTAMVSKTGVEVRDRSYLGKNYPACFVGSEAVSWVHQNYKLSRHSAEAFLNRLYGFGLIQHVTHEHKVQDGHFFYRFD